MNSLLEYIINNIKGDKNKISIFIDNINNLILNINHKYSVDFISMEEVKKLLEIESLVNNENVTINIAIFCRLKGVEIPLAILKKLIKLEESDSILIKTCIKILIDKDNFTSEDFNLLPESDVKHIIDYPIYEYMMSVLEKR